MRDAERDGRGAPGASGVMKAAVVSTDGDFRETLKSVLPDLESSLDLELEIRSPYPEIGEEQLEGLRRMSPAVVFLDLESEPDVGLRFAQFLMDSGMTRGVVAAASDVSTDLLLRAMKAGVLEFVPKPVTAEAVQEAVDGVRRKTGGVGGHGGDDGDDTPGELFTVFSPKGGSGSTTLAVNLAVEIRRLTHERTALVDVDLELGEAALLLDVEPKFSIVDLLRNIHRVDSDLLASYIERHESGVELLSAPYEPVEYGSVNADDIRQILEFLRDHYTYVVADTPKTFSPSTLATVEESDLLLLLTDYLPSLRNVNRSLPRLEKAGDQKPDDWIRLVLNRYERRQPLTVSDIEETLGMEAFCTLANDFQAVQASINAGEPVVLTDPDCDYARDVRGLAGALTDVPVATEKSSNGLMGSLMGVLRGNAGKPALRPAAS